MPKRPDVPAGTLVQRVYVVLPPDAPKDMEVTGVRLTRQGAEALRDAEPGSSIQKVFAIK